VEWVDAPHQFALVYRTINELQVDLDEWLAYYNNERTHQGNPLGQ
jgi:transposase InsO family protein